MTHLWDVRMVLSCMARSAGRHFTCIALAFALHFSSKFQGPRNGLDFEVFRLSGPYRLVSPLAWADLEMY